jgi:putative copper resistance protein D
MTFGLGPALVLGLVAYLYARAVRVLGGRGFRVPAGQQAYWWGGFACMALAFFGPLGAHADKLVWAHMGEHVLMADIAVPLMLIGMRNPVLQNFLPPPILEPLARRKGLRHFFGRLRGPMLAIPVYAFFLYLWHLGPLFTAASSNDWVHALQHECFIAFSALAWWPVIEPNRRRFPAQLWKIPYVVGLRLPTMFLGMGFIVSQSPFYTSFYGTGTRPGGLSPVADQQLGGGIMMAVDVITLMVVLSVVFWRAASDDDAQAPVREARAEGDLTEVEDERQIQSGVQVAKVGQG